jgi:hypothetical protein
VTGGSVTSRGATIETGHKMHIATEALCSSVRSCRWSVERRVSIAVLRESGKLWWMLAVVGWWPW